MQKKVRQKKLHKCHKNNVGNPPLCYTHPLQSLDRQPPIINDWIGESFGNE